MAMAMLCGVVGCHGVKEGKNVSAMTGQRVLVNDGWSFWKVEGEEFGKGELAYEKLKPYLLPTGNGFRSVKAERPSGKPAGGIDIPQAKAGFDVSAWRSLTLPHDWGIEGPFKYEYDGATGKLPYWGVAWYRRELDVQANDLDGKVWLEVDGAMSFASVWVNGELAGGWPYGYTSWRVELTPYLKSGRNVVAIRVENPDEGSRWYPGGGIYRNVWVRKTDAIHLAQWGVKVTMPEVSQERAKVVVEAEVEGKLLRNAGDEVSVSTEVFEADAKGEVSGSALWSSSPKRLVSGGGVVREELEISRPRLWDIESPSRYVAVTRVHRGGKVVETKATPFGIRTAEFKVDDGFHLNGRRVRIQGVCMHHDLGALGAAVNWRALERQVEVLKEMGVNAIRTSHNPPTPELVELCDRMGVLLQVEAFDCWKEGKRGKDYNILWDDWHEADIRAMVRHFRNAPSVVMWSIGNEIPDSAHPHGADIARELARFVRMEDQTRVTTIGSNKRNAGFNGVQEAVDVFGINYLLVPYNDFREKNPNKPFHASETSSCLSSRGEYFFPETDGAALDLPPQRDARGVLTDSEKGWKGWMSDFQVSSYDLYPPRWGTTPDHTFQVLDERPWVAGEFVWTGFDYIGEPTPYNDDSTVLLNYSDPVAREAAAKELAALGKIRVPSRSSYFGIVDLAGFKKDRFYLYQARWRPGHPMAHLLPHWTWPGREGKVTPVHVYTSGDEAELFVNGVSQGRKKRGQFEYRLRWDEVTYQPGVVKVVAYKGGKKWAEDEVRTAGVPAKLKVEVDRTDITADGRDLAFVSVTVLDDRGVEVPRASTSLKFEVEGPGEIVATDNGDATSFVPFASAERAAYNGKALGIVRVTGKGAVRVKVSGPGVGSSEVRLTGR